MHDDEISIDEVVVRGLINEQFPEWTDLAVKRIPSEGTVNAIFRIGSSLAARFPLQRGQSRAAAQGEAEVSLELAEHTTFRTPIPVAIGRPGRGYRQSWSIQTWLDGTTGTANDPGTSTAFAYDLATFISEVRLVGTNGRSFAGAGRGGRLPDHDEWVHTCLLKSEGLLDVERMRRMWSRYRELADHTHELMVHGDLIPGNVLVAEGRLTGVLDVGGLRPADPSLDLVGAWHILEDGPRDAFRTAISCTALEWKRGEAWAFEQAMGLVWYYRSSNPAMSELGLRTLGRLTAADT